LPQLRGLECDRAELFAFRPVVAAGLVDLLVRRARTHANGQRSVQADLRNIEHYVRSGIDRSNTRGVAIFACSEQELWKVIELPVPVSPQIAINAVPAVGQLEAVLQQDEPICVLAVDRQRARLFLYSLGELLDYSEVVDELPRDEKARGKEDRGGDHPGHIEGAVAQHVRNTADTAFQLWQDRGFAHLTLAARDELATDVEAALHPYLKDRLTERLDVPVTASEAQLRAAVLLLETKLDQVRQAELVEQLREAVGAGRRGVAGLDDVLSSLGEHRIDRLLVSRGYSAPGWRCDSCQLRCTVGRRCKRCGAEMVELDDVVEEAVQDALAQSCEVEVCENADLDVLGRIGALLRF
jgi:peptide chain release factor subunit 1